jgi:hypothetical protein
MPSPKRPFPLQEKKQRKQKAENRTADIVEERYWTHRPHRFQKSGPEPLARANQSERFVIPDCLFATDDHSAWVLRIQSREKMVQKEKSEGGRRARRRNNGMAATTGVADPPTRGSFTRTLALLRAALRAWEARNEHLLNRPVWERRDQKEDRSRRSDDRGQRSDTRGTGRLAQAE